MKNKIPTERDVLLCIYKLHYSDYPGNTDGSNDPYIAIDIEKVAKRLSCKPELIFGYLYYHLDAKHRYKTQENITTHLFTVGIGGKRHALNFPYMSAILAGHNNEHRRQSWTVTFSVIALFLSVLSIVLELYSSH